MNQPTSNTEVCSPLTGVMHQSASNLIRLQSLNALVKSLIDGLDINARKTGKADSCSDPKEFPGILVTLQHTQEFTAFELDDLEMTIRSLQDMIG